ncbi:MAG: STAS domain-containing protein [Luteimonas sp.]
MPASKASVMRDGDALVFTGALLRGDVAALWRQASRALDGVRRFNLTAVPRIDSAGMALLAELANDGGTIVIDGAPAGLTDLQAAYRLTPQLAFATV